MLFSINSGLNFMRMFISTLFLLCVFSWVEIDAQTQPVSAEIKPNPSVCNQELFEKAEKSYDRRRRSSELAGRAERELKEIVANCADHSWYYQAEEYLKIVQEESAERNFIIARYYWNRFQTGQTKSLGGVSSRLMKITEEYPNYSQIMLVNQLLDKVNKARFN